MSIHEQRDFALELVKIKHKAGVLGLIKTMHALEAGVQAVGWEIAEHIKRAPDRQTSDE